MPAERSADYAVDHAEAECLLKRSFEGPGLRAASIGVAQSQCRKRSHGHAARSDWIGGFGSSKQTRRNSTCWSLRNATLSQSSSLLQLGAMHGSVDRGKLPSFL